MKPVKVGVIGLGNVGSGTLAILAGSATSLSGKLGFPLEIAAVCSPSVHTRELPALPGVLKTTNWRDVVDHPEVDIVAELVGGTGTAREIIEAAFAAGKSVVTANKELLAAAGTELWQGAQSKGVSLAMEASVAGGIPIHTVLRDGISGDRIETLFGILNGTCNYILTEIEQKSSAFASVLSEAQRLGYAEADPTADVDGFDARAKLAILAGLAFGQRILPAQIFTEGIRRVTPLDFAYAHTLKHTIRLICAARRTPAGLFLSVRPSLLPQSAIMAGVTGAYNAVWVKGQFGQDTFYYGRGAGPQPTGVAVVSDLVRVARELRHGARTSPFAHVALVPQAPLPIEQLRSSYYLRFRVKDTTGIIAKLAGILAGKGISIDAVLQLPNEPKEDLPFVITVAPAAEGAIRAAVAEMAALDFVIEPPLAMPMEEGL